ncbi:hypothetical protein [Ekhidna sp.]
MKYTHYIFILFIAIITSLLLWIYIKRASFDYDSEGRFFSSEDGAVYHEQTLEVYGLFALFGLILTGVLIVRLIIKRKHR